MMLTGPVTCEPDRPYEGIDGMERTLEGRSEQPHHLIYTRWAELAVGPRIPFDYTSTVAHPLALFIILLEISAYAITDKIGNVSQNSFVLPNVRIWSSVNRADVAEVSDLTA